MSNQEKKSAKVISFINMKGGVGKTTLTKEVGYFLSKLRNKSVLFVDLDPQSNLTQSFFKKYNFTQKGLIAEEDENTDYEEVVEVKKEPTPTTISIQKLFKASKISDLKVDDCILRLEDSIHLIPGTLESVFLERNSNIEGQLYNFIKNHELRGKYDYIFIDCPPTYSYYTIAGLISSDFYITPSKPDAYSVLGIKMLHNVVEDLKDHHQVYFESKPILPLGVVITETQPKNTGIENTIRQVKKSRELKTLNIHFFENPFVYNSQTPKKAEYFVTDSKSSTLDNLTTLVDEFERRIKRYE